MLILEWRLTPVTPALRRLELKDGHAYGTAWATKWILSQSGLQRGGPCLKKKKEKKRKKDRRPLQRREVSP